MVVACLTVRPTPPSVADRWFCPTGSGAMLLREDTKEGADWQIRGEAGVGKAMVDRTHWWK